MEVKLLTNDEYGAFFKFNADCYPNRPNILERFKFQSLANPFLKPEDGPLVLLAYIDEGQIVGQLGLNPEVCFLRGKEFRCFFGYDLFVSEKHRGQGIGSLLVKKAIEKYSPFFAVGVSQSASKLYSDFNLVGSMHTFLWFRKVSSLPKLWFNNTFSTPGSSPTSKNSSYIFPKNVSSPTHDFKLVSSLRNWPNHNWNGEVMELSRSLKFLQWRFFSRKGHQFYVWRSRGSQAYFVVNIVALKGLRFLALVDYRISIGKDDFFRDILSICKKLAKEAGCEGVVLLSSHTVFDRALRKSFFIKAPHEQKVLINSPLPLSLDQINKRESLFLTMADADFEFSYGLV